MSQGEKVLDVNVFQSIKKGEFKLDKDTESWMNAELRQRAAASPVKQNNNDESKTTSGDDNVSLLQMLPTEASNILQDLIPKVGTWELDILGDYQAMQCRPLYYVVMAAVHRDGMLELFCKIRTKNTSSKVFPIKQKFMAFLTALESNYDAQNSYHNNCHAADVVNSMVCLLNDGKSEKEMTVFQRISSLVAAAAHDVGHTGQNNGFHSKYSTTYALQYSDRSVMEMHHLSTTFQLLNEDRYNMFGAMSREDYGSCRKLIIEMIMATDLAKHFDLLNNYSITLDKDGLIGTDKLLEIVLKAADIGHAVKDIPIHQKWSQAVRVVVVVEDGFMGED